MNVLLINVHSCRNAGDSVLTRESIRQLQQHLPRADLILSMNDPESYQGTIRTVNSFAKHLKDTTGRWRWYLFLPFFLYSLLAVIRYRLTKEDWSPSGSSPWRSSIEAYLEADVVVSCAGNFLYSSGRFGLSLAVNLFAIAYAWMAGKPLYTMPQTIGPITRRWERWSTGWILKKARLIMLRDPVSWSLLHQLGLDEHSIRLVPDVAFAEPLPPRQHGTALLQEYGVPLDGRPLLGITLINWGEQNRNFGQQSEYEESIAKVIDGFLDQYDGHVVLFSQVQGPTEQDDDRIPAKRVYNLVSSHRNHVTFIDRATSPGELKAAYGQMYAFIGTRLHSNIFALCAGVPLIAIQYQYKTEGILKMLGLDEWIITIENVKAERLTAMLDRLLDQREELIHHIESIMLKIQLQAAGAGALIADDLGCLK